MFCACSPGIVGGVLPASSWGKRSGRKGPCPGDKGLFPGKRRQSRENSGAFPQAVEDFPAAGAAYKRFGHRPKPWRRGNSFAPSSVISEGIQKKDIPSIWMGCLFSGTGDEARTRFRPPHKGPLALCRGPGRPRIEKTRSARFEVEAASSGKGGVLPRCWWDTKRATRPELASAHPTKGLWPFAGTPGALGLEKTRSARFRWR